MPKWLNADLFIPENDAPNADFFKAQTGNTLKLQQCNNCNMFQYPPRTMCPDCRSQDFKFAAVSGKGTIHSYYILSTPIHPAFHPHPDAPVALIEIDEQRGVGLGGDRTVQPNEHRAIRMVGNIMKPDGSFEDPENVAINKRVKVQIVDMGDGMGLPQWELSDEPPEGTPWQVPGT